MIKKIKNDLKCAGRSRATAYRYYILGLNKEGVKMDQAVHLHRGSCLKKLTDDWLGTWEDPENL